MNLFLAIIAIALAIGGWRLGLRVQKLPGHWWAVGYAIPVAFILAFGAARRFPQVEFLPPITWLMAGRTEFILMGGAVTLLFTTLLPKLSTDNLRKLITVMVVLVAINSLVPFIAPAMLRGKLSAMETRWHGNGEVCAQTSDYTCGPASAVTGLRRLGVDSGEGALAVAAHTTHFTGTEPDELARAINRVHARDGVVAEYRWFDSLADLPKEGSVLLRIKYGFMMDHWVAWLGEEDGKMILGDPLSGRMEISAKQLRERWRHTGVWIRRAD